MEWYNYQKDIMDSGALGGPVGGAGDINPDAGDYKGFWTIMGDKLKYQTRPTVKSD